MLIKEKIQILNKNKNFIYYIFRRQTFSLVIICVVSFVFILSSCSKSPQVKSVNGSDVSSLSGSSSISDYPSSGNSKTDSDDNNISANSNNKINSGVSSEPVVSGTLRLWMQKPDTLNPLVSKRSSFNGLIPIFYEGLYQINDRQQAVGQIAKSCIVGANNLSYTIKLNENVKFHDGSKLVGADVISSVFLIKNPVNASPFFNDLSNVSTVIANSTNEITFMLVKPDPFFVYKLIFPVLPDAAIKNTGITIFPGTGPYKIISYKPLEGIAAELYTQHKDAKDFKIKKISILELEDTKAAMKAFGDDLIDMVVMNDAGYENYYLRNDISMARFQSGSFLFFQFNESAGKPLNNAARKDYIRDYIKFADVAAKMQKEQLIVSKYPFFTDDPLLKTSMTSLYTSLTDFSKTATPFTKADPPIKIVYSADNKLGKKIVEQTKEFMTYKGINVVVAEILPKNYTAVLKTGDYDIALREAVLDNNPDPSWMFFNNPNRKIIGSDTLAKGGNPLFVTNLAILERFYTNTTEPISADVFNRAVTDMFQYGPYAGLGFRINSVLLSKRVNGQLESNAFNKYNNIKDVWVWSGQ